VFELTVCHKTNARIASFQIPTVLLLQELLQNQTQIGRHYADGLDGCGLDLETSLREAYYTFVKTVIGAIRASNRAAMPR
jgi:hypothetical protein